VGRFLVLAQRFAVIRQGRHDGGPLADRDRSQQAADLRVHERDLAVAPSLKRGEGFGRLVGLVGIVQVHQRGRRARGVGLEPGQGPVHGLVAAALGQVSLDVTLAHLVVVLLEAAAQAVAVLEDEAAHEGARPIAPPGEGLGQRRRHGVQDECDVVVDPGPGGRQAGHQARVRRKRQRHVGVGFVKDDAAAGELVEHGRDSAIASERPDLVRSRRVHRDEHDVDGPWDGLQASFAPGGAQEGPGQERHRRRDSDAGREQGASLHGRRLVQRRKDDQVDMPLVSSVREGLFGLTGRSRGT
jgi:hypothetical protein